MKLIKYIHTTLNRNEKKCNAYKYTVTIILYYYKLYYAVLYINKT